MILDISKYSNNFIWQKHPDWKSAISRQVITEGSHTGRTYDFTRSPYFEKLLDDLEDDEVTVIGLKCASQIGKTRLLISIALEWIYRYGTSVIYYAPKHSTALEIFKQKLLPTVLASPHMLSILPTAKSSGAVRNAVNSDARRIVFINGGSIEIKQGRTSDAFKSSTAPLVICDELDEVIKDTSKQNGDVIENLITRTASYPHQNHKVIVASTPTKANIGIEKFWKQSRQYRYNVACPSCGNHWQADFADLKWPHTEPTTQMTINAIISDKIDVTCLCPACGKHLLSYTKNQITNSGIWVENENEDANKHYKCYHLSGLHSTRAWKELAITFLEAKTDNDKFKQFQQQILAEVIDSKALSKIAKNTIAYGNFNLKEINDNIYVGIDVQTTKQEIYISYLHVEDSEKKLYKLADYNCLSYKSWNDLETIINDIASSHPIKIAIDTGSQASRLYEIIKNINDKHGNIIIGVKGNATNRSDYFVNQQGLLLIHPHTTNERLDDYILTGQIKFPRDTEQIFVSHLQNEIPSQTKSGKLEYVPRFSHAQNDYRDSLRYAMILSMFCNSSPTISNSSIIKILGL